MSDDIERLERFVARFRYKKSKAKQAQAKLSQIGRLEQERRAAAEELESMTKRRRTLGFEFLKPARTGRIVLEADDLVVAAGEKLLLDGASLVLERGEHVALVGPNGSGKTTLLETLLGFREPDEGRVKLGHGVVPRVLLAARGGAPGPGLDPRRRRRETGLPRPQAQNLLGRFLFSGWETHEKQVSVLSGGERRRLALALVVASGANLLVLDEPTNHLDLESREALEAALEAFPGTVLLVSHDRAVLDAVPDRIVAVEDLALRSNEGGWADIDPRARAVPRRGGVRRARAKRRRSGHRSPLPSGSGPPSSSGSRSASRSSSSTSPSSRTAWRRAGPTWTCSRRTPPSREELDGLLAHWEVLFAEAQVAAE